MKVPAILKKQFQINEIFKKQVDLNILLENMIESYKDDEYKIQRYINNLLRKKYIYENKIKKVENESFLKDDLVTRFNLYISTCGGMVEKIRQQIEQEKERKESLLKNLKINIWETFFDALINNCLCEETLIEQGSNYCYSIPSAKLIFKKQQIVITNKIEFDLFLTQNNIEFIEKDFKNLNKHFEIAEDETIVHKITGLVADCLEATNHELEIKFL